MVCTVLKPLGLRNKALSRLQQFSMSRELCDAFHALELGEDHQSANRPQCVFVCQIQADSRDPNVAFDSRTLMLMAHRALVHRQHYFELSYACVQERDGFVNGVSMFGDLPHRADIQVGKRWFSSIPSADLFCIEYNYFSAQNVVVDESSLGIRLRFSYAFVSTMELHSCAQHRCDLFDRVCGCCRELRWKFPAKCIYSGQLRCDHCFFSDRHTTCYTHYRFEQALWKHEELKHLRLQASQSVARRASQNAV